MSASPEGAIQPRSVHTLILTIFLLPALLLGCSSVSVHVDLDEAVDFAVYGTYGWVQSPRPLRAAPGHATTSLLDQRVKAAVDEELSLRGLRRVPFARADLLVSYHAVVKEKYDVTQHRGPRGYVRAVDVHEYKEGTLVLDFIDTRRHQIVWRGIATSVVGNNFGKNERQVAAVVGRILDEFPVAAGDGSGGAPAD